MTTHVEIPGVNSAVEHLQELGERMLHDYGFNARDVDNIDKVIGALRDLEFLRTDAHQRLEAETIRSSIQRHKLQFLPQKIKQDITDAVSSAQKSNAESLIHLKKQLETINLNIAHLEEHQKTLDSENALLHPEREHIRELHENIISQLNQRMAEKASMQIHLNETRDKVRQTNQEIVDLEDGILQLKDDLIQERGEARTEKRRLKKAVASATEQTKEQKQVNVEKKKEMDVLQEKLVDSEGKVDVIRKSLRRYETSRAKLEGQERILTAHLQKQVTQNGELQKKRNAIISEDAKLEKEFTENEKQLTEKKRRLEIEIEQKEAQYVDLCISKKQLAEELENLLKIGEEDKEKVAEIDAQLQADKGNLSAKAEEVGELQAQNTEMQEAIEQMIETHKALETELEHQRNIRTPSPPGLTEEQKAMLDSLEEEERAVVMAQLTKQIDDYRADLARERKERLEFQEKKNSTNKELEDFKKGNNKAMADMNQTLTQGKAEHSALSNEIEEQSESESSESEASDAEGGIQLQKELRADDAEIKALEEKLEQEQKAYQNSFNKQQNQVDTMEREIMEMENSIGEKSVKIKELMPGFQELEKKFDDRTAAYEAQKKSIVELKGKKTQLEDQIKKAKEKKGNMIVPQENLRKELKQKRNEVLFLLKHHGEETQALESEIYVCGCQLRTVIDENFRFEMGCTQLNKEIEDLQNEMDLIERLKGELALQLIKTKEILEKSWHDDEETEQGYAERDQCVVDEYGVMLEKTIKREEKISHITRQLEEELGYLTKFLENLASRRPKDSRERRRPLSQDLKRPGSRSQILLDLVAEANRMDSKVSPRPTTSHSIRSTKSVIISKNVTEIQVDKKIVTTSIMKL